jgi:hypothetical protein
MAVGRHAIEITHDVILAAETLSSQGLNKQEVAECLGMGTSTLYEKMHAHPELMEALKRGRAKGIAHVTAQLLSNINSGNVTAQIFYLKTVAQWKEAREPLVTEKTETLMQQVIDKL